MEQKTTVALFAMALSLTAGAATDEPHYVVGDRPAARASLPFSEAVWSGNTLYVSGHLGTDPKTQQLPQDPALEAKFVLEAVKATVERAGLTMDDLVSVTVYCTDLNLYDTFNTAYKGYFHANYPARAFVGVAQILRGGHFEVQGVAVRGHEPAKK
ncbi:MAG TPA: Rid family hydrolase [Steroidobacteraceae bacterium]|nr:Rid family hydrolase [Steroidobacteraceae bacterium]